MKTLTYEQAKLIVLSGGELGVPGSKHFRRKLNSYTEDGDTWRAETYLDECDGTYVDLTPLTATPARDYRAERDALRLRLDDVMDELTIASAQLSMKTSDLAYTEKELAFRAKRSESAGARAREFEMRLMAARTARRAAEDGAAHMERRVEAAEAEVTRLRAGVSLLDVWKREAADWQHRAEVAEFRLREVASAVRAAEQATCRLTKLVPSSDIRAAVAEPPAPTWPAVGEQAPWTTVWDHLQAEPRARYEAEGCWTLAWGEHNKRPGEMTVMSVLRGEHESNRWTDDGRDSGRQRASVYTRLPDAESP